MAVAEIVLNVSVCGVEHRVSTNVNPVLSDVLQDTESAFRRIISYHNEDH